MHSIAPPAKFTMAVVGHPFYAGGHDATEGDAAFTSLKELVASSRRHDRDGGRHHDFDALRQRGARWIADSSLLTSSTAAGERISASGRRSPGRRAHQRATGRTTDRRGRHRQDRRDARRGGSGRRGGGRGASPRGRSRPNGSRRCFDYNVAPFFQSFVEVKVERSANRVRVIPYGVHGRLTWGEVAVVGKRRGLPLKPIKHWSNGSCR